MAGNYQLVQDVFTLQASGVQNLDIDRLNFSSLVLLITQSYQRTANPTGCTVTVFDGFGPGDSNSSGGLPVVFGGSSIPVFNTSGSAYTLNSLNINTNSPQSSATSIRFVLGDDNQCSRWIRLQFHNTDPTYSCTLKVVGDI